MKKILSIAVFSMIIISSCQKEDEVTPLLATVDSEISAQIGAAVILDGSASDGLDRAEVQWIYNGGPVDEGAITYDNDGNMVFDQSSITTSFMPTKTGQYQFILRLTEGGEYSEASVTVTVSGISVFDWYKDSSRICYQAPGVGERNIDIFIKN